MNHPDAAGSMSPAPGPGRALATRPVKAGGLVDPAAGRPAAAQLDLPALLRALRRRWVTALFGGLFCAAVAAAVAWLVVPRSRYTTRALLHVSSVAPSIIFKTSEQRADFATYQRTQLTLIKSRLVLNTALNDEKVRALATVQRQVDPVAWLEKEITASYAGEVLMISMTGGNPSDLKILVNAVADAYIKEIVDVEANERRKRYDDLREIYTTYQNRLQEKRGVLNKLAEQVGANDKDTVRLTHEFAIQRRSLMQSELLKLKLESRGAEAELAVKSRTRGGNAPRADAAREIESKIAADKYLQDLDAKADHLATLRDRVHRLARRPASEPTAQHYERELAKVRGLQDARRSQLRTWYAQQGRQPAGQDPDLLVLRERVQVLKQLERVTEAEVKTLSVESQSINKNSLELEALKDEIDHQEVASKRVGDEVEALSVELHAPARVRLMEPADAPRLEADKRPLLAGMAGAGALGMVVLGIALLEYRTRRIGTIDEVVYGLGLRLVGALPEFSAAQPRRRWIGGHDDDYYQSLLVESVDATRTMLLHASESESARVVLVTSALGGEGKTSLACHLATSLARAGRATLLLDGDLRNPAAHRIFDLEAGPGFAELLRGEATFEAVIQAVPEGGPRVIAAGQCDLRAIQALAQRELADIFERLRGQFEFIIVDSSPILPVADAMLIGQHVDAALCSILQGVSRVPQVLAANQRLSALGIRILGAVVSGARDNLFSATYHYPVPARA